MFVKNGTNKRVKNIEIHRNHKRLNLFRYKMFIWFQELKKEIFICDSHLCPNTNIQINNMSVGTIIRLLDFNFR